METLRQLAGTGASLRRLAARNRHQFLASLALLFLVLLAGCASSPHVAMPAETPFDRNSELRTVYLDSYFLGYTAEATSGYVLGPYEFTDNLASDARVFGWYDGQAAAAKAMSEAEKAHK